MAKSSPRKQRKNTSKSKVAKKVTPRVTRSSTRLHQVVPYVAYIVFPEDQPIEFVSKTLKLISDTIEDGYLPNLTDSEEYDDDSDISLD